MKRISKGYCIAAAVLFFWAVMDFYHYAVIGKELFLHYEKEYFVRQLVKNDLFQGVVKAVVGAAVLLTGFVRGNRERRRRSALTAVSVRLGALLLALWLACMTLFTLGTAQYIFSELTENGAGFAGYVYQVGRLGYLYSDEYAGDAWIEERRQIPGILEYSMNEAIGQSGAAISAPSYDSYPDPYFPDWMNILRGGARCETATIFLDNSGSVIRQSGDFLYFGYLPEEDWLAGSDVSKAYGWMDLSDEEDSRYAVLRSMYAGDRSLWDLAALRLTGYFEGSRFEPLAMDIMTRSACYNALEAVAPRDEPQPEEAEQSQPADFSRTATTSGSGGGEEVAYNASELDAMGLIEWDKRFDHTASAGRELVTIYAVDPGMSLYEPKGPVIYRENEYHESLLALLGTMGYYADQERANIYSGASQFDLWDMVVFSSRSVRDMTQYDAASGGPIPDAEFTIFTALRASPLRIAMSYLDRVYLITFALALMGFLVFRSSIRENLMAPVQAVNQGVSEGWTYLGQFHEKPPVWAEPHALVEHYAAARDALRINKNEITRLTTALEYAKTAEQNRRQMTSNIAHELKTPLAVIHSYAEGLKEHIAEDKRDKYIDVILSETKRTDSMVLEMLDLSRLEAGKVKLARDEVSLIALTRAVFEKLEIAAQAKKLQIDFSYPEEFTITADESRIAQVIENFATNAVKYTPVGGRIWVKIENRRGESVFAVENESEPLPREALGKVWDTFYRVDESRTGGGTGLGLAIAKSIVELHGGRCAVRNTSSGVEFSFFLRK